MTVLSSDRASVTMSLYQDIKLKRRKAENSTSRCSRDSDSAAEPVPMESATVEASSDSPDSGLSSGHSDSGSMSMTSPLIHSPPESPPLQPLPAPPSLSLKEEREVLHTPSVAAGLSCSLKILKRAPPAPINTIVVKTERPSILESTLLCERRSPDSPSERASTAIKRLELSRALQIEQPASPLYSASCEEHMVTSTPMGLSAAPADERMSPALQLHLSQPKLAVPIHGSSLGAGGVIPYNLSAVATTGSLFPLNNFMSSNSGILTGSYASSNKVTTSVAFGHSLSTSPIVQTTASSMEYQPSLSKAKINGIVPELIRGGEILHNSDIKCGSRPHNNTTNTVVLGAAGGYKTMCWLPDKPRESLNTAPPRVTISSDLRASIDGMLSLSRSTPTSSSSISSVSTTSPLPHRSPYSSPSINTTSDIREVFKNTLSNPSSSYAKASKMDEDISNESSLKKVEENSSGRSVPLNMELLWQGDKSQLHSVNLVDPISAMNINNKSDIFSGGRVGASPGLSQQQNGSGDEDDPPLICMICDDSATGLHYGIITCEGCKGFFKRTVQNKRVYNCAADGRCEVNKQQRNRCQYCRFRKCLDKGMVVAAVREDRMPGGRNSGAVYNLYKVKYKKKKKQQQLQRSQTYSDRASTLISPKSAALSPCDLMDTTPIEVFPQQIRVSPPSTTPLRNAPSLSTPITLHQVMASSAACTSAALRSATPEIASGNILKAALTNPAAVSCYRPMCSSSPRLKLCERVSGYSTVQQVLADLKLNDRFQDCALMKLLPEYDKPEDLTKECNKRNPILYDEPEENVEFFFADKVACNLMQWISRLPFGDSSANHLLSMSCFGLVVLNAAFFLHYKKASKVILDTAEAYNRELMDEMTANITALKRGLAETTMSAEKKDDLLTRWVPITEKLSEFTTFFGAMRLEEAEFLLLKVVMYTMQAKPDMTDIVEADKLYRSYLNVYCQVHFPTQPNRVHDLLNKLSEISEVSKNLLLSDTTRLRTPFFICDNR